ncbi:transcriptional regulator [Azospirillum thermophilum]|uniref:Transcriptional regulator n=2 Tax=Azospirillum thermophilum TaxID=2202148 RepID=A0A2S2CSY1_9PROT|nr:transcriptional regulator [Azospirillum thermophilum]
MPEICRFFGIIIVMYYNDHAPPHFHARYGSRKAAIDIETLGIIDGELTPRALGLVTERAARHREELRADWDLAPRHEILLPIAPLE